MDIDGRRLVQRGGGALAVTMPVVVMQVRIMRMLMSHGFMPVPVGVWFGDGPLMPMLVVRVMDMGMVVPQRFVLMLMIMSLCQVQP